MATAWWLVCCCVLLSHLLLVCVALECGQPEIAPDLSISCDGGRIVGGCTARPHSWPWQAAILLSNPIAGGWQFACGGSLITELHVLTAAHCVRGREWQPETFRIKLGMHDRRADDAADVVVTGVRRIVANHKFNFIQLAWDVAVLELTTPVPLSAHIQPVCLPASDSQQLLPSAAVYVTGWGSLHEGSLALPHALRQVQVPVLDRAVCHSEYGASVIDDDCMFCAGRTGFDSCQGDSGGPLVMRVPVAAEANSTTTTQHRWFQFGIVSWGYGCAEPGHAGVYARVSSLCAFIETAIGRSVCIDTDDIGDDIDDDTTTGLEPQDIQLMTDDAAA